MHNLVWCLLWALLITPGRAHAQPPLHTLQPEAFMDFWVGRWQLQWEDADGGVGRGTNRVEKILGGQVIRESFSAEEGRLAGYQGRSYSVYNPNSGGWKQTWVDNNSGYIALDGQMEQNRRIFITRSPGLDGDVVLKRMVFYAITHDSLIWDWESSSDNGKTWKLQWRIFYKRMDEE